MQITEAIRMQMEVQHRLQEQLEVIFLRIHLCWFSYRHLVLQNILLLFPHF